MATRSITFRDIISFSAEHPQNKVQNLLKTGKTGKWTSPKHHPEATIDVELSLPPCYIKSLDVGNHWTAVLEIEVGTKEGNSKREPLLKSPSTLMSRIDCQIGSNKDAMKFYTADDDFTTSAKNKWVDRIRFVCRQPFRRDVLFGLSTVAVRGISVDDLDAHPSSPPGYSSSISPSNTSNNKDFESTLKNAVGLAGLATAYQKLSPLASTNSKATPMKNMSESEIKAGVENLKSKLSKQKTPTPVPPKAKYASLFASLDAANKGKPSIDANPLKSKAKKQSPAQNRKRKAADEDNAKNTPIGVNEDDIHFRKSVITFMRNIDPLNEFGYKELTRLWIAEKGHPQTNEERTILKEVAKNHTYGKPQKCEPTPPPSPSSPKSASSQQSKKFVFKKKAAVAAAKEAAEKAAAESLSATKILQDGSNGKCKRVPNDHLQDIQLNKSPHSRNTIATYDTFSVEEPIINEKKQKGTGQGRRKSKKKSIEELLGPSAKENITLDNKFDSLLQSPSPQHNAKPPSKDIRSKYDNFDYHESSSYDAFDDGTGDTDSSHDLFSSRVNFKVPQDYLKYNDDEVREVGILVQVRQYKKDKFLPLTDGSEVKVDKGTFVTFFKNAHQIHMKINENIHIPDVEPDHIAGIFKDYTEKEISDSDRIRSSIGLKGGGSKQTGSGVLPNSGSGVRTIKTPKSQPSKANAKTPKPSTNIRVKEKKNESSYDVNLPINGKGKKAGANKKKLDKKTEDIDTEPIPGPTPNKKSKKSTAVNNSVTSVKKTTPKKAPAIKASKPPKSAKKTNKKPNLHDTDSASDDDMAESPTPIPKGTMSRKRVSNSGGECPLCSRTFSRTRDLMEHCSTCEGTTGAGTSGSGGGRGKGGSKTPKPVIPKANLSDCPICSKKVPAKDLERHARLCAENMYG